MARTLFLVVAAALVAGALYFCFWRQRPYVLVRFSAARAIEATAEFQHKTKLFFEIAQVESAIPGACHNFEFSPDKFSIFKGYLATGAMQFSPYRNQLPPFHPVTQGSLTLSTIDQKYLVDAIDECKAREVKQTTGAYELTLGKAVVFDVTGIRKEGHRALVDFRWRFESLNEIGRALPEIQITKEIQASDPRTTVQEKSMTPFWVGSAKLTKYDDGWRVTKVDQSSRYLWDYGPEWPDEGFNWHTFDEHDNRWAGSSE